MSSEFSLHGEMVVFRHLDVIAGADVVVHVCYV